MLLLVAVFFVFSTCTVLLEHYAVQYYYQLRSARKKRKQEDDANENCRTTTASLLSEAASAPTLIESPTASEAGDDRIPCAAVFPTPRHVSVTPPIRNNNDDGIRNGKPLPLHDGSSQTVVHVRNRDAPIDEVHVDVDIKAQMEQRSTANVFDTAGRPRHLEEEFQRSYTIRNWNRSSRKKCVLSPPTTNFPDGLLQPMLPKNDNIPMSLTGNNKLLQFYPVRQKPQHLLPRNKYAEPIVAMDGENAVVACKQSIHFFAYSAISWTVRDAEKSTTIKREIDKRWREIATIHMPHIYCTMSVAISGNTAVVGVPKDSSGNDKVTTGVVYIYEKQADAWIQVTKFVPPLCDNDNFRGANVGYSVDIDGDTLVIGVPSRDSMFRKGVVYVLRRSVTKDLIDEWVQHSQLEMNSFVGCGSITSAGGNDNFGSIVSTRGNVIVASDGRENVLAFQYNQDLDSYVLINSSLTDDANEGKSCATLAVTTDGGIFVGCETNDGCNGALFYHIDRTAPSSGRYLLHQTLDSMKRVHSSSNKSSSCKCQVSLSGSKTDNEIMIMGATSESNRVSNDQVQIYKMSNNSWERVAVIDQPDGVFGSMFGNSVAVSKNHFMIASSNNVYAYNLDI